VEGRVSAGAIISSISSVSRYNTGLILQIRARARGHTVADQLP